MDELEPEHQQPSTVREGNTRLVWATASSSWNSIANTKIYTQTQCAEHPCKPCLSPAAIFPFCSWVQWDMNCPSLDSEKSSLWSGSWMELPTLRHHIAFILLHLWGHNLLLSHFPIEPVTEFLLFFFFWVCSVLLYDLYDCGQNQCISVFSFVKQHHNSALTELSWGKCSQLCLVMCTSILSLPAM